MKVLVACEYSGRVRDAFIAAGHYAISVDLLPTDAETKASILCGDGRHHEIGIHYQGDIFDFFDQCNEDYLSFDLLIAHPPCTYLTCAAEWAYSEGPYHQKIKPETLVGSARQAARIDAINFVKRLQALPIKRKCIENPVGVLSREIGKPTQTIQPHMFGDDASKATCLWLDSLPPLQATSQIEGRLTEWPKGSGKIVRRWGNQTDSGQNKLSPSADRWKERSKTYHGIALAMANQWGNL